MRAAEAGDRKPDDDERPVRSRISGAGVLHIASEDVVRSKRGKRQMKALKELKDKGFLTTR